MAFGKDKQNLDGVVPYGGSISQRAAAASRRQQRSSSSGPPYFIDCFKPTMHGEDLVRLIAGDYTIQRADGDGNLYNEQVPWMEACEHYHGGLKKGCLCSAGPLRLFKGKRNPCYGCDMFWEDWEIRDAKKKETGQKVATPNRVSMSDKWIFTVIHLAPYFRTEQLDKNGQPKLNQQGQPYMEWRVLRNPNDPLAYGKDQKMGHLMPWMMGKDHFDALNAYGKYIGQCCTTCGQRGCIDWIIWQCGNPECGFPIIRKADTTLNEEQIDQMTGAPYTCQQCNVTAYLEEIVECVNCTPVSQMPQRASYYDVDIQVKRQGSNDSNKTQLIIPAYTDPKPLDPQYADLLSKPIDLAKRFSPSPLQQQAEYWNYQPAA